MYQTIHKIIQNQPLSSSKHINLELAKVIAFLLRDFISNWFSSLTPDQDLYVEIAASLSYLVQELERRFCRIDWVGLLSQDLPIVLTNHIRDFRSCSKKMGTAYSGGKSFEELFYGMQPHVGLRSEESEREYLRRVSEIVLDAILPDPELQSDAVRMLIREIFCNNVLMMLIDVLSDPDWLNDTLLRVLNPDFFAESPASTNGDDSRYDYQSDVSENYTETEHDPSPVQDSSPSSGTEAMPDNEMSLFQISKSSKTSFLKRRPGKERGEGMNAFTQGLNKITFGGLEKVTNGLDKIKGFVTNPDSMTPKRKKKREKKQDEANRTDASESDFDPGEFAFTPPNNFYSPIDLVVPEVQVEDYESGSRTPVAVEREREDEFEVTEHSLNVSSSPISSHPHRNQEVSFSPEITTSPPTIPVDILANIQNIVSTVWKLHRETIKGPWKLGPINTALYERCRLEESILDLFAEIFEFNYRQNWIYTQLHYFVKPIVLAVGGHVINRAIMRLVYFCIDENSVSTYLQNFRLSFWPNNIPAPPFMVRSESEKAKIRESLERSLSRLAAGSLSPLIREQTTADRVLYLVDIFQNRRTNKHLLFIIVDLILVNLVPEHSSLRSG